MFQSISLCLAIFLSNPTAALAQTDLTSMYTVSEAAEDDCFGSAVAIDGDTMVVGASGDTMPGGWQQGGAYIYTRSGKNWAFQARVSTSEDGGEGSFSRKGRFGESVALSGDTLVVGAPVEGTPSMGAVYVFVRSGTVWSEQAALKPAVRVSGDYFGGAVAISGDTIVVGAKSVDTSTSSNTGAAYVFVRNGTIWSEQVKLELTNQQGGDSFGTSVAIDTETIAIGCPGRDISGIYNQGAAYIFTRNGTTWTQQAEITSDDGTSYDNFGNAIALDQGTLLVGAYGHDLPGDTTIVGAAYVFVGNGSTWSQQAKLISDNPKANSNFAACVALDADTAVIGAPQTQSTTPVLPGYSCIFVRSGTTWSLQAVLAVPEPLSRDKMGSSVAVSGDTAIAGMPGHDGMVGEDVGAACVFERKVTTWNLKTMLALSQEGDLAGGYQFGSDVAIDQNTLVVGVPIQKNSDGTRQGVVHVFIRNGTTWTFQAELVASDWAQSGAFGWSVDISGETLVVGTLNGEANGYKNGTAYVFVRNRTTWTEQAKLVPVNNYPEDSYGAYFGCDVAISGDNIIIGALRADTSAGTDAGAAYIYQRQESTWMLHQKISNNNAGDRFGWAVDIDRDTAVIGAPYAGENYGYPYTGKAAIYQRIGDFWINKKKLTSPGNVSGGYGNAVAVYGNTVVIGAQDAESFPSPVTSGGAVDILVFDGSSWIRQEALFGQVEYGRFGCAVALYDNILVVGACNASTPEHCWQGAAYQYSRNGTIWSLKTPLVRSSPESYDYFGYAVAVYRDVAAVGAYNGHAANGERPGTVHVFQSWPADCNNNGISDTYETDSDGDGIIDDCDNCLLSPNADQLDGDGDTTGNVCDNCPSTANFDQTNSDDDMQGDACDNCPDVTNTDQADIDTDQVGDVCDNCPAMANPDQSDKDQDSTGDLCDNCPTDPDKTEPGECGCGLPDIDSDSDGVLDCDDMCPNTILGVTVDTSGCPPLVPGDFDRDGDVDSQDCIAFASCFSGPAVPHDGASTCQQVDFDIDNDIDLSDFGLFQRCYSGENNPANAHCAD